jgi:hypothetical protein
VASALPGFSYYGGNKMIPVPAIPAALKNKTFGPSDIKWVKNVNDKVTYSAYIPPDNPYNRVFTTPNGVFFCLQLNSRFTDSLNRVPIGDLILLYQRLQPGKVKCFTHLVTPIGSAVVQSPNGPISPWFGRWVQVIKMTGNQPVNSIPVTATMWQKAGFTGQYHDLSFRQGRIWQIPAVPQLAALQQDIWSKF